MGFRNLIEDHLSLPMDPLAQKMIEEGITVDQAMIDAVIESIENKPRLVLLASPRKTMGRFWNPNEKRDRRKS